MTDLTTRLRALLAFDEYAAHRELDELNHIFSTMGFVRGAEFENARTAKVVEALVKCAEALAEIEMRTHTDEAEGPELRAQNAANYYVALRALAEVREALGEKK